MLHFEESVVQGWISCQQHRKATKVAVVSLDLRKAFDSLPHHVIMQQLRSHFHLPAYIDQWIVSYLRHRQQYVCVNNASSSLVHVKSGVPQGSVLGPLLFIASVACLQHVHLTSSSTLISYADDLLITKPIIDDDSIVELQVDIDALISALDQLGLSVNGDKTRLMMATTSKRNMDTPSVLSLLIEGKLVQQCDRIKYLGVVFERDLSMNEHIKEITGKVRRMLGAAYGALRRWKQWRPLQQIYFHMIRPVMLYSLPLFYGITVGGDNALNRLEEKSQRLVSNGGRFSLEWPSLKCIAEKLLMKTIDRFVNGGINPGLYLCMKHSFVSTRASTSKRPKVQVNNHFTRNSRCGRSFLRRACKIWNE